MTLQPVSLIVATLLLTSCVASAVEGAAPADEKVLISTESQIDAALAKTTNGLSTFVVPTNGRALAILAHRETNGEVEVHSMVDDLLVGREGSAEILIEGRHVGGRETGPGEFRSGRIDGGRRIRLGPGDMIWIPAGVPHQMFMIDGGSVTYLALKYPRRSPAAAE